MRGRVNFSCSKRRSISERKPLPLRLELAFLLFVSLAKGLAFSYRKYPVLLGGKYESPLLQLSALQSSLSPSRSKRLCGSCLDVCDGAVRAKKIAGSTCISRLRRLIFPRTEKEKGKKIPKITPNSLRLTPDPRGQENIKSRPYTHALLLLFSV